MSTAYAGYGDQVALDAAYDVDKSVPDFDNYVRWYLEGSEAARSALPCRIGVPYGPTPILVFIHGGYWRILTADVFDIIAPGPIAADFAVINVTHALCHSNWRWE